MTAQDEQGVNAAVDPEVSHCHTVTACASCTRQSLFSCPETVHCPGKSPHGTKIK